VYKLGYDSTAEQVERELRRSYLADSVDNDIDNDDDIHDVDNSSNNVVGSNSKNSRGAGAATSNRKDGKSKTGAAAVSTSTGVKKGRHAAPKIV
jgi:hypothetical protein